MFKFCSSCLVAALAAVAGCVGSSVSGLKQSGADAFVSRSSAVGANDSSAGPKVESTYPLYSD